MATEKTIRLKVDSKGAQKNVDNLNKSLEETETQGDKATDTLSEGMESVDKATGGAVSKFKEFTSGIGSAVRAMGTLKGAIIATGIGGLLVAVTSLVSYFTRTERGAQKLREIMAGLGAAIDVVADLAVNVGEGLFNAFTNPQKAIEDLWEALKRNLINRAKGLIDLFNSLGGVIQGAFELDLDAIKKSAADASTALLQVTTGLDKKQQENVVNFFKATTEEIKAETAAATNLEKALNRVKVQERELQVRRAEANAEIEKQKFIADDVTKSFEERQEAARKAFELEQSIVQDQVNNERERLRILQAQAALGESNEETLQAIADQRVRVAEIEAQSATRQIELNNKLNALEKERAAQKEAEEMKRLEAIEEEKERLDEQEKLREEFRKKELEREKEAAKKRAEIEKQVADAKVAIAQGVLGAIGAFAAEGSALAKGISIAQTTIDTYQSAVAAYKSTVGIPFVGPALAPIAAATAIAAGVTQVRKIASTKIPGAKGGGGGTPSISAGGFQAASANNIAPSVNLTGGNPQLNQINESINGQQNRVMKAYVVSSDVTSQQALDRRITENATFQ